MHVFYTTAFQGDKAILNEEESLHLSKDPTIDAIVFLLCANTGPRFGSQVGLELGVA